MSYSVLCNYYDIGLSAIIINLFNVDINIAIKIIIKKQH